MESIINMKEVDVNYQNKLEQHKSTESIEIDTGKAVPENKKSKTKKKNVRCHECNIKCGMMTFPCDCGFTFCSKHVTRISHNCIKINENNKKKKKEIEEKLPYTDFCKFEKI